MIETEEQRRWWFATHPEFSSSHKERRVRGEKKEEEEESERYSPEGVDAYVDEQLKYATEREAEFLKIVKRHAGTEAPSPGTEKESGPSEGDSEARGVDARPNPHRPGLSESDPDSRLVLAGYYPGDGAAELRLPTLRELARLPYDMIVRFYRWLDAFWKNSQLGIDPDSIEGHHELIQKLRDWFLRAGMNPEEYIIPVRVGDHRLKDEGGLHTGEGMGRGGWWNYEWEKYRIEKPDATEPEIREHLEKLRKSAKERKEKFQELKRKSPIR